MHVKKRNIWLIQCEICNNFQLNHKFRELWEMDEEECDISLALIVTLQETKSYVTVSIE